MKDYLKIFESIEDISEDKKEGFYPANVYYSKSVTSINKVFIKPKKDNKDVKQYKIDEVSYDKDGNELIGSSKNPSWCKTEYSLYEITYDNEENEIESILLT